MKRRLITYAIAATAVFAASTVFASPATAAAQSPIEQFDTPDGLAYSIETPAVDAETLQLLEEHGIAGDVDELQYDDSGLFATYVVDDTFAVTYRPDQSRVVSAELVASGDAAAITNTAKSSLVSSGAQSDTTARAAEWGWGVCTGSFDGSRKVNNTIEWGGVSTCEGTPNSVYPHSISVGAEPGSVDTGCVLNYAAIAA